MPQEKKNKPPRPTSGFGHMNDTQWTIGACMVSAGVLLMLLDGGAHVIFSAVAGTSAYIIHNMVVDDIPADLKNRYSDEMSDLDHSDQAILMMASMLAAIGVVINPWIGVPALACALIMHMRLQAARYEELHGIAVELGMA